MLAANEAVAETLRDRSLHFLRRIHQAPSPQKIQLLEEFMTELGYQSEGLQSRFELQKLLEACLGASPSGMPSILPCSDRCNRPSTAPRTKATTPWPASAIAISPRRSAAIPI